MPLKDGTREQIEEYLVPSCRRASGAPASPSPSPRPAPTRARRHRADRHGDRFVINGEKWFVTSGDAADYMLVHASPTAIPRKPTLFLVDKETPGVKVKRHPRFTHT